MTPSNTDPLVNAFCKLLENDFSTLVLIPLLQMLGYENVQFHGGVNEQGKDLIAFKKDSFGTLEATTFVVKRLKQSTAASKSGTFHHSVTQLEQAAENPIPFVDGQARLPSEVVFVTPHIVTVKMLESRFGEAVRIRPNRLKYLDGGHVATLCREHCPETCDTILGAGASVADALRGMYTNNALLKLLGSSANITVDCFHVGLDFRVGRRSLNEFLGTNYVAAGSTLPIESIAEMQKLSLSKDLETEFSVQILDESYIAQVSDRLSDNDSDDNLFEVSTTTRKLEVENSHLSNLRNHLSDLKKKVDETKSKADDERSTLHKKYRILAESAQTAARSQKRDPTSDEKAAIQKAKTDMEAASIRVATLSEFDVRQNELLSQGLGISESQSLGNSNNSRNRIGELRQYAAALTKLCKHSPSATALFESIIQSRLRIDAFNAEIQLHRLESVAAQEIPIESSALAKLATKLQEQCRQSTRIIEESDLKSGTFKSEFIRFGIRSGWLERLIEQSLQDGLLRAEPSSRGEQRARLPLRAILQCGESTLLLGEAGSGKSTSLQAFAKSLLEDEPIERFVVYAPLGDLVHTIENDISSAEELECGIVEFLNSKGAAIDIASLTSGLKSSSSVLVLDALDEATAKAPSVGAAIAAFHKKHRDTQLIVSSRELGPSSRTTGLTPVTLRPFSEDQLHSFLSLYGAARQRPDAVDSLYAHLELNHKLHEVVRTPLLATVLCEIAFREEKDLPKSEVQLYHDRFRVLSGALDEAKGIEPRIESRQSELELACRKIAVALHRNRARYASREELIEILVDPVSLGWPRTKAQKVVKELEDPCQLLVLMSENNDLGFGHLRFQEFFCMEELLYWQSPEIFPLLGDQWWADIFILYALRSENVLQFFKNLQLRILGQSAKDTLQKMIKVLPEGKRRHIEFGNHENSIVVQNWIDSVIP